MFITAKNIYKTYRNSLGDIDREVLKGLDIEIDKGEKIAVMGPSGSGKTTMLNLLGTLDVPDAGYISIDNQLLAEMSPDDLLEFRNVRAGFVFQFHHLLPQCTLWENVLLPVLANRTDKVKAYARAEELLKFMGVWEQRNNKPGELSGGECQRAAVARALINQPDILLADEPTGSLDAENADALLNLLIEINKHRNVTMIIATHSIDIARKMDKIYSIANGILIKKDL